MSVSISEAIFKASQILVRESVPEARREAGSLLAIVLDRDRTFLISHAEERLDAEALERYQNYIERRASGEPLQYITGHQEFFGLDFEVTTDVLIPRPETELVIEAALELISPATPFFCDVGTGSGCIAITLLHHQPQARAIALDISETALRVAARNAVFHRVGGRIAFAVSDCFSALDATKTRFGLVVANPPYVPAGALAHLQREVREHEPRVALTPGGDGLSIIRRLLSEAAAFLVAGGFLAMEIGFDQQSAVEQLIDPRVWRLLEIRTDLQGIPRIVILQKGAQ